MMLNSINADEDNVITINKTEQDLIRFMIDWGNISGRRDTAKLDAMLADDLVMTRSDGSVQNKTEYLASFKDYPEDFRVIIYDQQVQIHNNTAIVRACSIVEMNDTEIPLRCTATFIKRRGKWEAISLHSSPLAMS